VLDGEFLAIGLKNGVIQLFDVDTWTPVRTLKGHSFYVKAMVLCGVDKLVSVSVDKTVRVWSTQTWLTECTLSQNHGIRCATMWGADKLVTGDDGGGITVYDAGTWAVERAWQGHENGVTAVAISPQSHLISAAFDDVKVWSSSDCSLLHTLPGADAPLLVVGGHLIIGAVDFDGFITVWDTRTWARLTDLPCSAVGADPEYGIYSLARCGRLVAVGCTDEDGTEVIKLLNPRTWTVEHTLRDLDSIVTAFALSNEGHLISGSRNGILKLWAAGTADGVAAAPQRE
jgi:WD40 repeat protein